MLCNDAKWILSMVKSIPPPFSPTRFSESEKVPRSTRNSLANTDSVLRYMARGKPWYYFHSGGYFIYITFVKETMTDLAVYGNDEEAFTAVVRHLASYFSRGELYYGNAATDMQHIHCNGFDVKIENSSSGTMKGFIGRDFRRYVPGLYWGNAFSDEYIAAHNLDIRSMCSACRGTFERIPSGYWVQFGNTPGEWLQYMQLVDNYVATTANFFSLRTVSVPLVVSLREAGHLAGKLGAQWP